MAKEKKKFVPKKKYFTYFGGIALCLLSIILIVNIGVVSRLLTFVPLALFGIVQYVFYGLLYAEGIYLLFKEKSIKISYRIVVVGLVITIFALLVLSTLIDGCPNLMLNASSKEGGNPGFWASYKALFSTNNYLTVKTVNVFRIQVSETETYGFGGGLLGYFITGLMNQFVGVVGSYIICIIALLLGLGFILLPFILKMVRKQMQSQGVQSKTKEKKKGFFTSLFKEKEEKKPSYNDGNVEISSNFSSIEEKPSTPVLETSPQRENIYLESQPFYQATGNGQFVLAKFHASYDMDERPSQIAPQPQQVAPQEPLRPIMQESLNQKPAFSENVMEEKMEPSSSLEQDRERATQILIEANERQNKMEQMSIFEEENKPVFDQSLIYTQPVYEEPKVAKQGVLAETKAPKERIKFIPPDISLLNDYETNNGNEKNIEVADARQEAINQTFNNFKVGARCVGYIIGPSVTRYNIEMDLNVSVTIAKKYIEDICIRLGGVGARFQQIVPGESYSGLEIPNAKTSAVSFKEIMVNLPDKESHPLAIGFGKNISGQIVQADFNDFPHCLVAGTTGSGKSVFVHSVLMTLIMRNSPDDLKLVLIDPKQVEMNMYDNVPHLLTPIINDANRAKYVLTKLCDEMDRRYSLFKEIKVLDVKNYNKNAKENNKETLPYIVIIFDEYADCVDQCKDIAQPVVRIAQKARAAGIHMLIATQRPSVNVVTGVIKGNLPTHIALMTSNVVDSQTILNEGGAEKLLGKGDMLVQSPLVSRVGCVRLQSPYVTTDEIRNVVNYLIENYPVNYDPEYDEIKEDLALSGPMIPSSTVVKPTGNVEDDMYQAIKEWAMAQEYASMSRIQREFGTGFNRAGRLFKRLQDEGIVASAPDTASSAKGCRVLVHDETTLVDQQSSQGFDTEPSPSFEE